MLNTIRTNLGYDNPTQSHLAYHTPFSDNTSHHEITKVYERDTGTETPHGSTHVVSKVWHITYRLINRYHSSGYTEHNFYYVTRTTSVYAGEGSVWTEYYEINPGPRQLTEEEIKAVTSIILSDNVPTHRAGREL